MTKLINLYKSFNQQDKTVFWMVVLIVFMTVLGMFFPQKAEARNYHKKPIIKEVIIKRVNDYDAVIAINAAKAEHSFDFGTYKTQGSMAIGQYNQSRALSLGFGKRFKGSRTLITGSMGISGNERAGSMAINFRF